MKTLLESPRLLSVKKRPTAEEVREILSRFPTASKQAVINFLLTLPHNTSAQDDYLNMRTDAKLYGWNDYTRAAITEGISIAFIDRSLV